MMKLSEYFGKDVFITDVDGSNWQGYVVTYTPAIDSDVGEDEIAVRTDAGLIGFCSSEIETIQKR